MKNLLLSLLLIINWGCKAQNENNMNLADSLSNKPQTKILVNKEYDENGNLVRYDSTYSYFYSNIPQESLQNDSTFTTFKDNFLMSFPDIQRPFFNDIFFEDSLLHYDFFKDDFFKKRFDLNRSRFERMFEKMDSLKNKFYMENLPKQKKS